MAVTLRTGAASPVIQSANNTGSVTASYGTLPKTAGDLYVAYVGAFGGTSAGTITEGSGTWTKQNPPIGTKCAVAIFTKAAAGGDAAPTFTCTMSGTASHERMTVYLEEYGGQDGTTPVIGDATSTGTSGSLTLTATAATPDAGCWAVAAIQYGGTTAGTLTHTAGSGWSNAASTGSTSTYAHFAVDRVTTAPGSGTSPSDAATHSGTATTEIAGTILVIQDVQAEASPALILSGFGSFTGISPWDTINSVTVSVYEFQSAGGQQPCTFELWDGTSSRIGATQTGTASTAAGNVSQATFTGVSYTKLATLQVRVYGHGSSGQVESVDSAALAVAYTPGTPPPPLDPPLDTAWQAGGTYWHLYNDTATRDRREYFYQRTYPDRQPDGSYTAGPSYAQGAWWSSDDQGWNLQRTYPGPPPAPAGDVQVGSGVTEAWWGTAPEPYQAGQRAYVSDPSFYPVQPDPVPLRLAYGVAATHCDRREVPQQRPYVSDPGLLVPPAVPLDPTTDGWPVLRLAASLAATHVDRREVPQQRAYISDPGFYPTVAPTDPLTVAWGAGGRYWHLYNRAADAVPRWWMPRQRTYPDRQPDGSYAAGPAYVTGAWWSADDQGWNLQRPLVSDPSLLLTALLESPFLGGGDTGRHYTWFTDRREVPAQRAYFAGIDLPLDPTLAAWNDLARRYLLAITHADRRLYPQQRPVFPLPPPPPAFQTATSTASVTAQDTSAPAVYAPGPGGVYGAAYGPAYLPGTAPSGPTVSDPVTSQPSVSDG